jgi:N6-L-threonylcarbamoyladenine synthase
LYRCDDPITWEYLGGTIDDAAGEAFDKVAVMLGLPFPGGPELSKLAQRGDPKAIRFPRPLLDDSHRLDFSFSGLKTAVRYRILGVGKSGSSQGTAGVAEVPELLDEQDKADVAASFEQAVIDCLVGKAILAVKATGLNRLCIGGGVAANQKFRSQITAACASRKIELVIAKPQWCTDNAVMGALAWEKIRRGQFDTLELDAQPGLVRPEISRPNAIVSLAFESLNADVSITSRIVTTATSEFGTSIPIADFPGIGASIRMSLAASASAISSVKLTMRLTFTPTSGCNS